MLDLSKCLLFLCGSVIVSGGYIPRPDCTNVACPAPTCSEPRSPRGECCPVCPPKGPFIVPHQCRNARCDKTDCEDSYIPEDQCCPVCRRGNRCSYKGKRYNEGEVFKDDCNTCRCSKGRVSCTEIACVDPCSSVVCTYPGCGHGYEYSQIPPEGQCCRVCGPDCRVLTC